MFTDLTVSKIISFLSMFILCLMVKKKSTLILAFRLHRGEAALGRSSDQPVHAFSLSEADTISLVLQAPLSLPNFPTAAVNRDQVATKR